MSEPTNVRGRQNLGDAFNSRFCLPASPLPFLFWKSKLF
jgi:hypothetical protein